MYPIVSVIIPVLNTEKYLPFCMESVFRQTIDANVEIILVDDGSEKNCKNLCRKYANAYPDFVRVFFHDRNYGLGYARNTGIVKSRGKYIFFLDSDDAIKDTALDLLVKQMESRNLDVVTSSRYQIPLDNEFMQFQNLMMKTVSSGREEERDVKQNIEERLQQEFLENYKNAIWLSMYRSSFLKKNQIYFAPVPIGEEILFHIAILLHTNQIHYINDSFYIHRIREGSMTNRGDIDRFQRGKETIRIGVPYLRKIMEKKKLSEEMQVAMIKEFVHIVFTRGMLPYIGKFSEEELPFDKALKLCCDQNFRQ